MASGHIRLARQRGMMAGAGRRNCAGISRSVKVIRIPGSSSRLLMAVTWIRTTMATAASQAGGMAAAYTAQALASIGAMKTTGQHASITPGSSGQKRLSPIMMRMAGCGSSCINSFDTVDDRESIPA